MTAEEYRYEGSVEELQKLHEEEIQEAHAAGSKGNWRMIAAG